MDDLHCPLYIEIKISPTSHYLLPKEHQPGYSRARRTKQVPDYCLSNIYVLCTNFPFSSLLFLVPLYTSGHELPRHRQSAPDPSNSCQCSAVDGQPPWYTCQTQIRKVVVHLIQGFLQSQTKALGPPKIPDAEHRKMKPHPTLHEKFRRFFLSSIGSHTVGNIPNTSSGDSLPNSASSRSCTPRMTSNSPRSCSFSFQRALTSASFVRVS